MSTQGDYVELALGSTETTETELGTITIPSAGVSRVIGVWGVLNAVQTTAEYVSGYFRLAFGSIAGTYKFPTSNIVAGAGTLAGGTVGTEVRIIPVNIPVPNKESVKCFMNTSLAQTGNCKGAVGLIFE